MGPTKQEPTEGTEMLPSSAKLPTTTVVEVFSNETPWEVARTEVVTDGRWLDTANHLRKKFSSDYSVRVNEVSSIGQVVCSTVLF